MTSTTTYNRPMARYRLRTWLRGHTPWAIAERIPKGARDCGDHEWYTETDTVDRCYHCEVGVRSHVAEPLIPGSAEMLGLIKAAGQGSAVSAAILARRLTESREALGTVAEQVLAGIATQPRGDGHLRLDDPSFTSASRRIKAWPASDVVDRALAELEQPTRRART